MDPGRKSKEYREASFIAVGDRILLGSGVYWTVDEFEFLPGGYIGFFLSRKHGDRNIEKYACVLPDEEILCKTVMGPTS
jgi:hypothetical protein